jgi:Tetratricopeptide repeat
LANQTARGDQIVQIQNVEGSSIRITYGGRAREVPLEPAIVRAGSRVRSPARLVLARSGVVPYSARTGLLGELQSWLHLADPFAGFVIGGRGGSGKTRLAVELCEHALTRSWLCGLLMARIVDRGGLEELATAPMPRLVVVDYAETRTEQLEALLPLLRAKATAEYPVRVLLLVRASAERTEAWTKGVSNRNESARAALDECELRVLDDLPLENPERELLFSAAAEAFAARAETPTDLPAPPSMLGESVFSSPLLVVIAAYLAVHGDTALPETQVALLDELLAHEERYWWATADDLFSNDEVLPRRVVGLVTLVGAESEAVAAELLRLLPDLEDATAERRRSIARWAGRLYPGAKWWNPLEPDLVGEHLVAETFTDQPGVLEGVLSFEDPRALAQPLEVYARVTADHPQLKAALRPIISDKLRQLCAVAVAQASTATDHSLVYGDTTTAAAVNRAIISVGVEPEVLPSANDSMPPRMDLILGPLALTLITRLVEHHRALAAVEPDLFERKLAASLNNLSNRLGEAGRAEEGLAAAEESVEIRRRHADADPAVFEPDLARSLNNVSLLLGAMGRDADGLLAAEESTEIRRRLALANPAAYEPELASSLNNLSLRLGHLERSDEGLARAEESVEIYRRLAKAEPTVFEQNLAKSLNNLATQLRLLGRSEVGLPMTEESLEIRRRLALANPAAFEPDVASSLTSLSLHLWGTDRNDECLTALEESIEIYRRLATANPSVFGLGLGDALSYLSLQKAQSAQEEQTGHNDECLMALEECIEIYRRLAVMNPTAFDSNFAALMNTLAIQLLATGQDIAAAHAREELARLSA